MFIRRGLLCVFSVAVLCGAAWGQTTKPVDKKFDDGWLGEIVLEQLRQAVEAQPETSGTGEKYLELSKSTEKAILARLTCGHTDKLKALNDMVFVIRACRYLPLTYENTGDGKFAKWLIEHRSVSRRLFRALEDVRLPEESLKNLHDLVQAEEKKVVEYPDLAVAFATSKPMRHYRDQPKESSMLESFQWYTDPKAKFFRYDLKKMPYEISRYLAVSRLNVKERKWAVSKYRNSRKPAKSYFDLKYDNDHYRKGVPKKIAGKPYTLPNLRRVGGVCIEQAYYAAEVNRALGIPATIVRGRSEGGGLHAWVACLKLTKGGSEAVWDADTGRYESHRYYVGLVRNPCGEKSILDCELSLLCAATHLSLRRREQADTATELAKIVEGVMKETAQGDLSVLTKLAEQYNQKLAKDDRQARTGWIEAKRKIDLELTEALIDEAIDLNLAHSPVWELIVELSKSRRLPVDHLNRFFEMLVTRTAKKYPDYSCNLIMRIVPFVDDPARRIKVYKNAIGIYGKRPDLQGWIYIAIGEDYQKRGKNKKALRTYEQAATRCANLTEIVLEASGRAESMYIEARRRNLAIKMYKRLFGKAKKEKNVHSGFRQQTAHYLLGKRLIQLLIDDGKMSEAKRIEKQID